METINKKNKSSSPKFSMRKVFGGAVLATLIMAGCQSNTNQQPSSSGVEQETEQVEKNDVIQEPWEYKIYKLGLGSIVSIKGDIQKAKVKISNTPELKNLLTSHDIEFETIMPSIIKESMMDNSARSNSGAIGYFQLKPIAVKDVVDFYGLSTLSLNPNNPVDNVILGSLYRKRSMGILKAEFDEFNISFSESDMEKLMILSYNMGASRVKRLFKESKAKDFDRFISYLGKKIGATKKGGIKTDPIYGIEYRDPLEGVDTSRLSSQDDKKVAEGLRYLAIIDGISSYIKSQNNIEILGRIVCDGNKTLFSSVKELRDQGVFKKDSSINNICKIILETNGYKDTETPKNTDLILVREALAEYTDF